MNSDGTRRRQDKQKAGAYLIEDCTADSSPAWKGGGIRNDTWFYLLLVP